MFYRSKFDELELRLKSLLNTHSNQNSYLTKSPVILSYEKMLKFVHSVLARNGVKINKVPIDFEESHIEDGYASG